MYIDLNADLGEGCPHDGDILECVSSANIACGWHAGDSSTIREAVRSAIRRGVAVGAHPSFPDRENFGRTPIPRDPELVHIDLLYQIGGLQAVVEGLGGHLRHVKPHGALYNQAAHDPVLADAVARAVACCDRGLRLMGLAGSELIRAARYHGLTPIEEVFADRGYRSDGSLVPRGESGAVIVDFERALQQTLQMVGQGTVTAVDGRVVSICAESICIHGDGAEATAFARGLRQALEDRGWMVRYPG